MAVIYTNTNRDRAIDLVKAALTGGALTQIPTEKLADVERVRAHSLYIMRMISSLENRLDAIETKPADIAPAQIGAIKTQATTAASQAKK